MGDVEMAATNFIEFSEPPANTSTSIILQPRLGGQKLKFGIPLEEVWTTSLIHPNLHEMFRHLFIFGPEIENIWRLSSSEEKEKAQLKKALQRGYQIRLLAYSPRVIFGTLRNFLKHLPDSLLHEDLNWQWIQLAEEILSLPENPNGRSRIILKYTWLVGKLSPNEQELLRHLVVTLRALAIIREPMALSSNRLNTLADYIGPCILRKHKRKVPKKLKNVWYIREVIKGFVINALDIFGQDLRNIFKFADQVPDQWPPWIRSSLGRSSSTSSAMLSSAYTLPPLSTSSYNSERRSES